MTLNIVSNSSLEVSGIGGMERFKKLGNEITPENIEAFRSAYQQLNETEKIIVGFGQFLEKPSKQEEKPTYIYILQSENTGMVKIGRTINPNQRIAAVGTQSGQKLKTLCVAIASPDIEGVLHRNFKQCRGVGEWFNLTSIQIDEAIGIVYGKQRQKLIGE